MPSKKNTVTFKGFYSADSGKTRILYDMDLVKQDLLNEFNTIKGERVMDAEYGYIAWDLLFELNLDSNLRALRQDAERIVNKDPRVSIININATSFEYGYRVDIDLQYIYLDTPDTLSLVFDRRSVERRDLPN